MSREEVKDFFELLKETLTKNDLINSPGSIYNMDETGIQLNNKPGNVIATKGSKDVYVLTASEKGETVSVIACNNAEGIFLPPVLILKGVRKNPDHLTGLPPGCEIYMNQRSSYMNSDLFLCWLKNHFTPRKGVGKFILILDGHVSHCSMEGLEFAEQNNIIIICLPSHTTQALQPLDRSFFKPLKDFFKQEEESFLFRSHHKAITRMHMGGLIGQAWAKATTVGNGCAGFKATGIHPFNPHIIPEHFFQMSDSLKASAEYSNRNGQTNASETEVGQLEEEETLEMETEENKDEQVPHGDFDSPEQLLEREEFSWGEQTVETTVLPDNFYENDENYIFEEMNVLKNEATKISPSKYLEEVMSVPNIPVTSKERRKQSAIVLTSPANMELCKKKKLQKEEKKS
ncbi:hypothetical protein MML48_2g00008991 [Holotrichia oblita]|uniref:Uncharacterized protein n=1 Tax=Holotrichia oblita TaxID=644536 RepID=A0ACB9TN24_HOLOL|nr:hypothetical protein MML48_2g00008991 [Holotrichia oblita]